MAEPDEFEKTQRDFLKREGEPLFYMEDSKLGWNGNIDMNLNWATGVSDEVNANDDDDDRGNNNNDENDGCQNFEHPAFIISLTPHNNLRQGHYLYPILQMRKNKSQKV